MGSLLKFRGFTAYIIVVFLNAFVDLGHKIVIQNTVFKIYEGQTQIILTAIVNALILLPFILLISPAGYCSDKYPKTRVIRISAWVAVLVSLCITLFYYLGWFWAAFLMTFMLALQSAFYSPSKYGFIKEMVGKNNLARANGLVQAITTIAILAGIFVFSIAFEQFLIDQPFNDTGSLLKRIAPIGWGLVLFSLIELALACTLTDRHPPDETMQFDFRAYRRGEYLKRNMQAVLRHEVIFLSIMGLAIFWSISQVMLAAFPSYAEETLGIGNTVIVQGAMACAGFGIMLGSVICGRLSRSHIETGMIPLGLVGIALCLFILPYLDNAYLHAANFLIWGLFGGLLIIPLNALIQFHAGQNESGRVLAGNNFLQNCMMLSFLGLTVVFALYGIDSLGLFSILLLVAGVATLYLAYKLPQSLLRLIVGAISGQRYRLRVLGLENMPETGAVWLLGEQRNGVDCAILQMASPRSIRFVVPGDIHERRALGWFADLFKAIPAGFGEEALGAINKALHHGDMVCLFARATASQSGRLAEFQEHGPKAGDNPAAVILPFYLHDPGKRPARLGQRQDIIVAFGRPLPIDAKPHALDRGLLDLLLAAREYDKEALP